MDVTPLEEDRIQMEFGSGYYYQSKSETYISTTRSERAMDWRVNVVNVRTAYGARIVKVFEQEDENGDLEV